jgi:hypothetical protein
MPFPHASRQKVIASVSTTVDLLYLPQNLSKTFMDYSILKKIDFAVR